MGKIPPAEVFIIWQSSLTHDQRLIPFHAFLSQTVARNAATYSSVASADSRFTYPSVGATQTNGPTARGLCRRPHTCPPRSRLNCIRTAHASPCAMAPIPTRLAARLFPMTLRSGLAKPSSYLPGPRHVVDECRADRLHDRRAGRTDRPLWLRLRHVPGHVESGEERFLVEWDRNTDQVWFDILAFSRPRHILTRIGHAKPAQCRSDSVSNRPPQ